MILTKELKTFWSSESRALPRMLDLRTARNAKIDSMVAASQTDARATTVNNDDGTSIVIRKFSDDLAVNEYTTWQDSKCTELGIALPTYEITNI
jgi:hypothetical protein